MADEMRVRAAGGRRRSACSPSRRRPGAPARRPGRARGRDRPHADDHRRGARPRPGLDRLLDRMAGRARRPARQRQRIARGEVVVIDEEFGLRITSVVSVGQAPRGGGRREGARGRGRGRRGARARRGRRVARGGRRGGLAARGALRRGLRRRPDSAAAALVGGDERACTASPPTAGSTPTSPRASTSSPRARASPGVSLPASRARLGVRHRMGWARTYDAEYCALASLEDVRS